MSSQKERYKTLRLFFDEDDFSLSGVPAESGEIKEYVQVLLYNLRVHLPLSQFHPDAEPSVGSRREADERVRRFFDVPMIASVADKAMEKLGGTGEAEVSDFMSPTATIKKAKVKGRQP